MCKNRKQSAIRNPLVPFIYISLQQMESKELTLSELLGGVKQAVSGAFPLGVWVTAEIGELKVNPYSGHCYMELVEKGSSEGAPKAKAAATVWRSRWGAVESYFRAATGRNLAAGMQVLLKVSVTFHEIYGFSLSVTDIDPSFTLGGEEQRRRETIERLKKEGVIDLNSQLPLPMVVQRIAVVSSATAAGLQDFGRHLESSPYRFEPTLFEALMQGADAEESIVAALERIADRQEEFDAVVVIRGGGSRSDLACFDSYFLCNNIAQFPLPVLTGIGHDKDVSVADIVANRSLKTPTAVADFLVELADRFTADSDELYSRITERAAELLERNGLLLQRCGLELSRAATAAIASARLGNQRASGLIGAAAASAIERRRNSVERCSMLLRVGVEGVLTARSARLDAASETVRGNDPHRILSLGFAIVRHNGKAQRRANTLTRGDELEIELSQGEIKAKIS